MQLMLGDCLERMSEIEDGSVDMVLCDLPYGTTSNAWDSIINLPALWQEYTRICRGRVVLTAAQPFTSLLVMSAPRRFKHSWTWVKPRATGFQNAKRAPMRATEDILVFCDGRYNPQGLVRVDKVCRNSRSAGGGNVRGAIAESVGRGSLRTPGSTYIQEFTNYPRNVLEFGLDEGAKVHPTQKPVALLEYLIRTYTNDGETVLDNTMGSGSTGVAAAKTGRRFIGIEREPKYYEIAQRRISDALHAGPLFEAAE
jgi:hypothetical protein